jgi:AraC family cel operon transcriptional repressor
MNSDLYNCDFTNPAVDEADMHMVDYHENTRLRTHHVSFHWWNEHTTTLHYHNYFEIFLVTRGSAQHRLNGSEFMLRRNTIQLIRPQDVHRFAAARGESCTHMNLLILPERMQALCAALHIPFDAIRSGPPMNAMLGDADTTFFLDRAEQVSLCGNRADDASRIILEMIAEALSLLYRRHATGGTGEWFAELLLKLRSPEYLTCRASDVYALCPYSAPVLIRRFRESKGCTVVEYLTRVKMDYAQSFLLSTNFPVHEIASRLGYDSLSHFCRIFKNRSGMTPQQYRRHAHDQSLRLE